MEFQLGRPTELDTAVKRLIRLQDPGLPGGSFFRPQDLPTSPGVILVCYESSEEERLPHPGAGDNTLVESLPFHHRFLKSNAGLLTCATELLQHERPWAAESPSGLAGSEGLSTACAI